MLLSILKIVATPVFAGVIVLLIFRRAEPAKFKVYVRLVIALTLTFIISDAANIAFSISSPLTSVAIGLVIALVIGAGLYLIEASIKSKSTDT